MRNNHITWYKFQSLYIYLHITELYDVIGFSWHCRAKVNQYSVAIRCEARFNVSTQACLEVSEGKWQLAKQNYTTVEWYIAFYTTSFWHKMFKEGLCYKSLNVTKPL